MRRLDWLAVVFFAGGCAAAVPPAPVSAPPPAVEGDGKSSPPPPLGGHTLARSAVRATIAAGLGAFLRHVELDDQPVLADGKFRGFRITALRDAALWNGVDLKPGDVVTSLNGFPIERPEQAQTAFDSLAVASELRLAYDRDGHPRELVYTIAEDR